MGIKTFQLHFSEEDLDQIRETAKDSGVSIKSFMLDAIAEKVKSCAESGEKESK